MTVTEDTVHQSTNMRELFTFIAKYTEKYIQGMSLVDLDEFNKAVEAIRATRHLGGNIYVGGNGGSAAISNHLCCDFTKGSHIKSISLSCNTPLITAIANDIGYHKSLSYQIDSLKPSYNDILILISSSGNSANIIEAAKSAKARGMRVIGLTGFKGGALKDLSTYSLHVPIENYGVVEDAHQSIMHIISQYLKEES